jgi:hypothetical protein
VTGWKVVAQRIIGVPPLPSIGSVADRAALFANFLGIIDESDCSVLFIVGYDLRSSRCGPANGSAGQ